MTRNIFDTIADIALFGVFLTLPFASIRMTVWGIPIYPPETVIALAALSHLIASRKKKRAAGQHPFRKPLIGLLAVATGISLSALSTETAPEDTLGTIKSWILFPGLFGYLVTATFGERRDIRDGLLAWFLVSALVSVTTFFPGPTGATTFDGRLLSGFPSPNHLALFLLPGSVIGWLFVSGSDRLPKHFLFLALEGVILLSLFQTRSLGAMGASFLGTAAVFLGTLFGKRAAIRLFFGTLIFAASCIGILFLSGTWERYASGEVRNSLASRIMIWNAAGTMIKDDPILGIGPRRFQDEYLGLQPQFPPYLEWAVPHPHDIFLSFLLSGGLPALFGLLFLLFRLLSGTASALGRTDGASRLLPATLFGMTVSFILSGLVDETYFKNDLALFFWTLVGFGEAVAGNGPRGDGPETADQATAAHFNPMR